ncbi:phage tail tape measure protein [Pseudomonas tohonis]|nr:phage tail tape measure protein [Pseudomonas tohonis]
MNNDVSIGIVIGGAVTAALRNSIKDVNKSVEQLGKELEETGKKRQLVDGLERMQAAAKATSSEFFANKKRVEDLKKAIAAAGQPVKSFEQDLARSQRALEKSKRSLDAQTKQLAAYRAQVKGAGIDVKNLTGEQQRLAEQQARLQRVQQANQRSESANSRRDAVRGERLGFAGEAVAIGYGIKQILQPAVELESALKAVEARVDFKTPTGLVELRKQIEALSESTGIAQADLFDTAALGGQFGIAGEKVGDFVEQAAQIGVAFKMSTNEAGEAIATLATVLQLPIDQTDKLLDAVNQLSNIGKASEAQILEVLGRVGGIGKQFGLVDTQIAALASTFLALGKSPEVASTGINAMLNKLQSAGVQTEQFQNELKNLVGDVDAFTRSMDKDAQGALDNFLTQLSKLDARGRAEAITVLFGQEYADDISQLAGAMGEYRKQLAAVADETAYAGSVQREFTRFNQGAAVEVRKATTAINNAFAALGEAALPVITKVAKQISELAKWLKSTGETGQTALMGIIYLLGGGLLFKGIRLLGRLLITEVGAAFATIDKLATRIFGQNMLALATRGFGGIATAAQKASSIAVAALGTIPPAAATALRALSVIGSFWAGWEFGTYLRKQFLFVEQAGIALASGLHTTFVQIKGFAESQFEALKFLMTNPLDYVRTKFAGFARDLGVVIGTIPQYGQAAAKALQLAADTITPKNSDTKEYEKRQKEIQDRTDAEVKTIKEGYFEQFELAKLNFENTKAANDETGESHEKLAATVKQTQAEMTKDAEAGTNQRIQNAAKETAAQKKAKKEQEALLKGIQDRTKNIAGEKNQEKEPTFNQASDLTVKARQSLQSKDYVQALKYADQATQVLEDLQKAGDKNTLALAGQAKAAQKIAEEAYAAIGTSGKDGIDKVKEVAVTPVLDPEATTQAQGQVSALAETLKANLVIPITTVLGTTGTGGQSVYKEGSSFSQFPQQGFAAGGFTGFGGRYQPAGIVHRGEYVLPQPVVSEPGAVGVLGAMRRHGVAAVLDQVRKGWGGYDVGGLVGDLSPRLPSLSQPALTSADRAIPELGSVTFIDRDGEKIPGFMRPDDFEKRLRYEARMRGKSSKR